MKVSNQEMNPLYGLSPEDAVDMLIADHKRVANLFADFKRLIDTGDHRKKGAVVERICVELSIHAQLEEELFYPAVRVATGDDAQVDEAVVEHASAKTLIAQLQGASPGEELYDARVTVLGEQINHHVEEEEGSVFPKARHAGVDTQALGVTMAARKAELQVSPAWSSKQPAKALDSGKPTRKAGEKPMKKIPTRAKKRAPPPKAVSSRPRSKRR